MQCDPQAGHKQAGLRPALVISPANYNGKTGLMFCCPMPARIKGYPFEVVTEVDGIACAVLSDQVVNLGDAPQRATGDSLAGELCAQISRHHKPSLFGLGWPSSPLTNETEFE